VQKSTSTVVIAFLTGVVVAGVGTYVATSLSRSPSNSQLNLAAKPLTASAAQQPAENSADIAEPADASPSATADANVPQSAPAVAPEPKAVPHKKPTAAHRRSDSTGKDSEIAAAPQPTQAAVTQPTATASTPAPVSTPAASSGQAEPAPNPSPRVDSAPPAPVVPRAVTLTAGMPLTVRLNETISTETNYPGDTFTATLDKPVVVDGYIIADKGSRVLGKVIEAQKAGRVKGLSTLSLALTKIHTTDGQTVEIQTNPFNKDGPTSKKRDAAEIAGGAALGAIIGAIAGGGKGAAIGAGTGGAAGSGVVLTQRGQAASVPSETRLVFSLESPVTVTEHLN
jgi:hypothetical protein